MAYVNKQNLSDFWTNAKRYIAARDADQCDWTSVPVNASSYHFEAEPRTPVNPVVEFGFTETPPAEGEKGPDNPSTITGVDSVTVTRVGKNLCPLTGESSTTNISVSYTADGGFVLNGSHTNVAVVYVFNKANDNKLFPYYLKKGGTYTFSMYGDDPNVIFRCYRYFTTNYGVAAFSIASGEKYTYTIPDTQSMILRFEIPANTVLNNAKFKLQIEEGHAATAFEPYSGVTATINLGETRYGGTLDVATGKMTVEWGGGRVVDLQTYFAVASWMQADAGYTVYAVWIPNGNNSTDVARNSWICDHIPTKNGNDRMNSMSVVATTSGVYFYFPDSGLDLSGAVDSSNPTDAEKLAAFRSLITSENWMVTYPLANPQTIDLDPQQLFSALSNSKVNIVFTDTGTISQLTYAKPTPTAADIARFANWHRTESAGAVAFAPVPETELHPVVNFSFTETPPAEGEKGPENPSSIAGVNEVKATRCGKNLITFPYFSSSGTVSGVAFTVNSDGSFTLNGTNTSNSSAEWYCIRYGEGYRKRIPAGTYTCSAGNTSGSWETYYIRFEFTDLVTGSSTSFYNYNMASKTFTFTNPQNLWVQILVRAGQTVSSQTFTPQIESASSVSSYELFEGSDYTVNLNGTYYGGSIDLSTGLMTVTHASMTLNGNTIFSLDGFTEGTSFYTLKIFPTSKEIYRDSYGLAGYASDKFTIIKSPTAIASGNLIKLMDNSVGVLVTFDKTAIGVGDGESIADVGAAAKSWLASNNVRFFYKLATPTTVQLTPQQIKALPALDRHEPRINTLYTDADSIQVSYQKSPIQTEREITDAILALGSGLGI